MSYMILKIFGQSLLSSLGYIRGSRVLMEHVRLPQNHFISPELDDNFQCLDLGDCVDSKTLSEIVVKHDMAIIGDYPKTIIDDWNFM